MMTEPIWIYLLISLWTLAENNGQDISIGVIQDGPFPTHRVEARLFGQFNVTLARHVIDVGESFQVFRAVRQLDSDDRIDMVVILNNVKLTSLEDHVMVTSHKPLVHWGKSPFSSLQVPILVPAPTTDRHCPVDDRGRLRSHQQQDYCFYSLTEVTSLRNGTLLEKVSLTVANIVSTLVTKSLHWTSVYIFHDNNTVLETYALVKQLSARGVLSLTYNLDVTHDLFGVLLKIYNDVTSESSHINGIVMCQFPCIRRLFWEANNFDDDIRGGKTLMKQLSRWLVASYGHARHVTDTLVTCAHDVDNVAVLALPGLQGYNISQDFSRSFRKILLDYEIMLEEEAGTDAGEDEPSDTATQNTFNGTLLEYVTENLVMQSSASRCVALKVETLMWRDHGREFSNVGYVTTDGDVVTFSDMFPNTKFGYNKRRFLVSTLHYPPFVKKSIVNGTAKYEGMCMDLLNELATNLNFTFDITEPPDLKWGSPGPNLTFNGMIGQLQREEIDIVAADISIQKEREMVMDFAFPFFYGDTSVLLKKPDPNARKWRTLVDPFKPQVLMAIGIILPVVSLLAFLFEKFNPFYKHDSNIQLPSDTYRLNTVQDAFWYMYGAILCQGGVNLPESMAGRTFVSCWWLFCIVLVATYCGNLIAFLTVTKDKPPFNTLEEMMELKDMYKWGTQAGTNWEHVFKTSTREEYRKVGDLMMEFNKTDPSVMATNIDLQLAKVKKGGYGWIGDTVIMEVEMAKDCDLMMIKEKFLPLKYAFGFTNNSPHTKIFSNQMLSIHESGLLHVWKRRWWPKASICTGSSTVTEAKPITVVDVQSAFYVAAGGAMLGFLTFLTELVVDFIQRHRCKVQGTETSPNDNSELEQDS